MNLINNQIGFIVKVLILSLAVSILIKYGGQLIEIAPTYLNATLAITIPPLLMAIALVWRLTGQRKSKVN